MAVIWVVDRWDSGEDGAHAAFSRRRRDAAGKVVCRWKRGGQGCAGLYAVEGDWKNAGISLAGAVLPYAGDALKATRLVKSLAKVADGLSHLGAARGVTCRIVSAAAQAGAGAAAGAASSFAYGFVNNYIQTGDLGQAWDKGVGGMGWGALQGGLAGGVRGLINPFVCFVAGTQVGVGVKVRRDDGRIETISAGELAAMQEGSGGVATRLEIVGYVTANIEDIKEGDWVISRDQDDPDGELVASRVSRTFQRLADHLQLVEIQDDRGAGQIIRCTEEHPFHVPGRGWTASSLLEAGDSLSVAGEARSWVTANSREEHPAGVAVYNLEVEGTHTYFVRDAGSDAEPVWVHNSCKVSWVPESASMSRKAKRYQSGAPGARKGLAPALHYENPYGGKNIIRFDGIERRTLIDRKLSFYSNEKAQLALLRASAAIEQNTGYALRIEVPTKGALRRGGRLLSDLGIHNIKIKLVPG